MILLETPRLVLRPFQDSDLEPFTAYRSDAEIARFQSWEAPYSQQQAQAFIYEMKQAQPGTAGIWYQLAIELKQQKGLIGDCAFHVLASDPRQAEIGYTLARQFQGQGYAAEAVNRLLDYLFNELHLHRVSAACNVENHASYRLLERLGMRREAHFIENYWDKGTWRDEFLYALLEKEWNRSSA